MGGGFEMCLSTDFRVMADDAKVGLPEVKLGIFPGFGGTVRLSRVIGADYAIEWICAGGEKRAEQALKEGAVDAVVPKARLIEAAKVLLAQASGGKVDYLARRE
ncbi:enoyl-CoA hydratase-related protein, partial [Arthrospira platensis SPKY1]|nr:enoyl-CoA hydratase-related protein [Arthrospira platensis SPKY1]